MEDSAKEYLKEIHRIPLLSAKEEKEVAEKAAAGDQNAKNKLIESNLRLVASIARNYAERSSISFMDACQEGTIGLMKAVDKYDVSKGYKFSTYATYWIKQTISRAIANQTHTIRTPVHITEALAKIAKAENDLTQKLQRDPTPQEIADATGLDIDKINLYKNSAKMTLSLDVPIDEAGEVDITDTIADFNNSPEQTLANSERINSINKVLDTLEEEEKQVLKLRFGLDNGKAKTLSEVSQLMGITKEKVKKIETIAMRKMRNPLRANVLRNELTNY